VQSTNWWLVEQCSNEEQCVDSNSSDSHQSAFVVSVPHQWQRSDPHERSDQSTSWTNCIRLAEVSWKQQTLAEQKWKHYVVEE
jgi:hypothetical protein